MPRQNNDGDAGKPLTSSQQYESWKQRYDSGQRADKFDRSYYRGLRGHAKDFLNRLLLWRAFRYIDPGRRILEVPCGSGRLIKILISNGRQMVALDISESMLQKMRTRRGLSEGYRNGLFGAIRGDVERLPLQTDSCSCVVSIRLMQAVASPDRVNILREMQRICDGPLFIQYQSSFALKHFSRWLRRKRPRENRVDRDILSFEAESIGLCVHRVFRKFWFFSEDVLVVFARKD